MVAKTFANVRVYEYVTADGNVFWSLTRLPAKVTRVGVMTMQDRKGLLLQQFIGVLRQDAIDTLRLEGVPEEIAIEEVNDEIKSPE
jgi:hypothetical protein